MKVYGKNVFEELKHKPQIFKRIYLAQNFKDQQIIAFIKQHKISYTFVSLNQLNNLVKGNHQGIIMLIDDYEYYSLSEILNEKVIVMLDHLEDPHNLGAIIRTCEAAGVKAIIIPKDRSVTVNDTVYKTSSGALSNVKIVQVNNLVNSLNTLKKNNYFIYGAAMDGTNYQKVDYATKVVLVIGNEGKGISPLIRKNCDEIISIPMYGKINSLNASVATAILIYDVITR